MAAFQQPSWIRGWPQRFKPCTKSDGEERKKGPWVPDDWGTSISGLGCLLQPLLLCRRKTCVLLNHLSGLLFYALSFLLTGTFLFFWRCLLSSNVCVLNRPTGKEKTAVWYLSLCWPWKERSYWVAPPFPLACLVAMKALKGMPMEVRKFKALVWQ